MAFAAQNKSADFAPSDDGDARMCLQPACFVGLDVGPPSQPRRADTTLIAAVPPEFAIRAYCRLCLGSGSTTRSARSRRCTASRRGGDGRDDGSGGDDGGDGPPPQASARERVLRGRAAR